jgi:hypothetical protein
MVTNGLISNIMVANGKDIKAMGKMLNAMFCKGFGLFLNNSETKNMNTSKGRNARYLGEIIPRDANTGIK